MENALHIVAYLQQPTFWPLIEEKMPNTAPSTGPWLDFYALLEVPVSADDETLRKRITRLYSQATANGEHRDLERRHFYQGLAERVLPQCRRVLLDPQWRARYDRQHILNGLCDPSGHDYVAFIAATRGETATEADGIAARVHEETKIAAEVVKCLQHGAGMGLLAAHALVPRTPGAISSEMNETGDLETFTEAFTEAAPVATIPVLPEGSIPESLPPTPAKRELQAPAKADDVRATVISAEAAATIRRRRATNPDTAEIIVSDGKHLSDSGLLIPPRNKKNPVSRVIIGESLRPGYGRRVVSPTALNLMVAIAGVLLTVSIQKFVETPAVATATPRAPFFVSYASAMEPVMGQIERDWEKTPNGANFDLVLQAADAQTGLSRALRRAGDAPDAWIPSESLWSQRFNQIAAQRGRREGTTGTSLAQTPLVLIARADRAGELLKRFPNHKISSWSALQSAVQSAAPLHFGLPDPTQSSAGAITRFSMAHEWGVGHNLSAAQTLQSADFWREMRKFEENVPSTPATTSALVKDLVLGTTSQFWWAVGYESEALGWMAKGKNLEVFYLPRAHYADLPFCPLERIGAGVETARARADFEKFLRSEDTQKLLLQNGFRPTELTLDAKIEDNPFVRADFQKHGVRRDLDTPGERVDAATLEIVAKQWEKWAR